MIKDSRSSRSDEKNQALSISSHLRQLRNFFNYGRERERQTRALQDITNTIRARCNTIDNLVSIAVLCLMKREPNSFFSVQNINICLLYRYMNYIWALSSIVWLLICHFIFTDNNSPFAFAHGTWHQKDAHIMPDCWHQSNKINIT